MVSTDLVFNILARNSAGKELAQLGREFQELGVKARIAGGEADKGLKDIHKGAQDAESSTRRAGAGVAGFSTAMKVGAAAAVAAGAAVGAFALKMGKDGVDAFKNAAASALATQRVMGGTVEQASRWNFVARESRISTELFDKGMAQLGKRMEANNPVFAKLGINVRDANGHLRPLNDMLPQLAEKFSKMPAGPEKTALAMQLFGKQGPEFLKILNRGAAGISELGREADKMGFTLSQGNVAAFKKYIAAQKELHAANEGLKIQIGAAIMPLLAKFETFIAGQVVPGIQKLTGVFKNSPMANDLRGVFSQVQAIVEQMVKLWQDKNSMFHKIADTYWKMIQSTIGGALKIIQGVLQVAAGILSGDWSKIWGGFEKIFSGAWQIIYGRIKAGFDTISALVTGVMRLVTTAWSAGWNAVRAAGEVAWNSIRSAVTSAFNAMSSAITSVMTTLRSAWSSSWNSIKSAGEAVWNSIRSSATTAFNAVKTVVISSVDSLKSVWSSSWNAIRSAAEQVWNALRSSLESVLNSMKNAWSSAWSGIRSAGESAWNAIRSAAESAFNAVKNVVVNVMNSIKSLWTSEWNAIRSAGEQVWNAIRNGTQNTFNAMKQLIENIMNGLKNSWQAAWNAIRSAGEQVWNSIKNTTNSIFTGIKNFIDSTLNAIKAAWQSAWQAVQKITNDVWNAIKNTINTIFNGIKSLIDSILNAIKSAWTSNWNAIKNVANDIWNAIKKIIGDAAGWIESRIKQIRGNVEGAWNATWNALKAGAQKIWDGIKEVFAAPVRFVVNVVIGGVAEGVNKVLSAIKLPTLPVPHVNFATGGKLPGYGGGDIVNARLEPGEAVVPKHLVGEMAPWAASKGIPGFAGGGLFGAVSGAAGAVGGAVSGAAGAVAGAVKGAAGAVFKAGEWVVSEASHLLRIGAAEALKVTLQPLIDQMKKFVGSYGPPGEMAGAIGQKVFDGVIAFIQGKEEQPVSGGDGGSYSGPIGKGVQQWAGTVAKVLSALGQQQSWAGTVLHRMNQESGGNPNIVNLWDSNAKKGVPSVGLMQVIGPTYQAYKAHPDGGPYKYNTSVDPYFNTYAGCNYAIHRYGSLAGMNRAGGYDSGGWLMPGWTAAYNGTGAPERVVGPGGESGGGHTINQSFTFHGGQGDGREFASYVRQEIDKSNRQLIQLLRQRVGG